MTTLDELERAIERLNRAAERLSGGMGKYGFANVYNDDVQLLLSERAELLATVERMQGLLEQMADLLEIANRSTDRPSGYVSGLVLEARAAFTNGEET